MFFSLPHSSLEHILRDYLRVTSWRVGKYRSNVQAFEGRYPKSSCLFKSPGHSFLQLFALGFVLNMLLIQGSLCLSNVKCPFLVQGNTFNLSYIPIGTCLMGYRMTTARYWSTFFWYFWE
jgi:hypothetical protein